MALPLGDFLLASFLDFDLLLLVGILLLLGLLQGVLQLGLFSLGEGHSSHAQQLRCTHPHCGQSINVSTPLDDQFSDALMLLNRPLLQH